MMAALPLCALQEFPRPDWKEHRSPDASPLAEPGGSLCEYEGPSPKSLNYYLDNNSTSARVFSMMYETLLSLDSETLDFVPCLANRWTISDDLTEYTFWLDPAARWSDGQPITAEDVVWTYQAIVNPKNLTGPHKYRLERVYPPEIVENGAAVRFKAKDVHWQTLLSLSGFEILPAHAFRNKDFNEINFEFPVTSGPYRIANFQEGRELLMKKNPTWWQKDRPSNEGVNNFDELRLVFYEDQDNAFDAFKKGEIDVFFVYTASQWQKIEEKVTAVRNNWIVKQSVHNHHPIGMQGFVMNMRRPLFQDVRVRQALAYLLDRDRLNRTMMFSQYFLHRSYWEDLYDDEHPNENPDYPYAPERAKELLKEAGWAVNPKTGYLEKDGRVFEFTFLSTSPSHDKYLSAYNEALKAAGIKMTIQNQDWSAWAKAMDEYNFDMTWAAWGSSLFKDPEQLWYSAEADRKGSSNLAGFKNAEVDALIERQRGILDIRERNEILRQIDKILCRECPYVLLWNIGYNRILYWNKFGTPKHVSGKYSGDAGTGLWWFSEDAADELADAMEDGTPLPPKPAEIFWGK